MNVYVISLADSKRRAVIDGRLRESFISYEFVDATTKSSILYENQLINYNDAECKRRYGRGLTDVERACFISHYRCWSKVSELGHGAIVLEDDALLTDEFNNALRFLSTESLDFDVVLLGQSKLHQSSARYHYFQNPVFNCVSSQGLKVGNVFKLWTSGAVGYYLSPRAARVLSGVKEVCCLADDWSAHGEKGLRVGELRPYVVWEDFDNLESSIEPDRGKVARGHPLLLDIVLEFPRFIRAIGRNLVASLKR